MKSFAAKSLTVASVLALAWSGPAQAGQTYTLNADFDKGTLSGVNHDAPGINQLQLGFDTPPVIEPYLWVANFLQDTVTKIDSRTGRQVGIYDSVLAKNWDGSTPPVSAPRSGCNSPSRTTVDAAGSAFVANRGFCANGDTTLASITKIGTKPDQCVDRNGNGQLDTSRDATGDGIIDINNPAEYLGQADECLLWTRTYAAPGDYGRSVAVDADQNLWLGGYATSKLWQLSNKTGELLRTLDPNAETGLSASIYGLAVGPGGFIYTSDYALRILQRIDPNAPAGSAAVKVLFSPVRTYGLAVDKNGIVWLGNYSTYRNGGLVRADFNAGSLQVLSIPSTADCRGHSRGVAVDAKGDVWAACWSNNRLLRFNSAGTLLASYPTAAGTLGVAIDSENKIWTSNQTSDTVTRIDPTNGSIQSYPAGGHPYSYWDMTGFQHRHFTMREGEWKVMQDSGKPGTHWGYIHWNQEPQGATPTGTSIRMYARASDDPTTLESQAFVEVTNNTPFAEVVGRHLQVKALLRTTLPAVTPVLSDLTVLPQVCWKDVTSTIPGDSDKVGVLQHEAVLLKNGDVLSVGGTNIKTTRLFNPATSTWSITAHTDPGWSTTRRDHTATLLPNGYVLVAGGKNGRPDATSTVYDPVNKTWTSTGNMNQARKEHTATLLPNGQVLVVGGDIDNLGAVTATAELYNPSSGTWTPTSGLRTGRRLHTATLLPDGRVLVAGGYGASKNRLATAEVFDSSTGLWAAVADMGTGRVEHTATLLPNGRVLVAGGDTSNIAKGASVEVFDSMTGTWTPTGSMKQPRGRHAAVLLKTGMVLVTGGYNDF
ncbi:MAG TPA: kelch repeat-containing protein, partial [Archangium sp.]|uniref:kelch repeat-containing protein n=1 Tax=Archangium sp. TaxID=1872627 RepID=UPI002ED9051F